MCLLRFKQHRTVNVVADALNERGIPTSERHAQNLDERYQILLSASLDDHVNLVHGATFAIGMEEKAAAYGHSTILQAAQIAARSNAKRLVVTHFSSRFSDIEVAQLVAEVTSVFPNIEAAYDYLELDV